MTASKMAQKKGSLHFLIEAPKFTLTRCISKSKLQKRGMDASKMAENKKKSLLSNRRGKLANRKANHQKKSDRICQVVEPLNNTREQMDIVVKAMGINFQEEFITEILIRLPVRSLLQSKCVSKFWETLISDPYFKTRHLIHARNNLSSQKLLVCQEQRGMLSFSSNSLSPAQLVEGDVHTLECPSNYESSRGYKVYSSCDGLVLLGVYSEYDQQLFLWNPSTRELALLPHSEFTVDDFAFGMGYDTASDSYKILKVDRGTHQDDFRRKPSVEALTLKGGSWKKILSYPTYTCPRGYSIPILPHRDKRRNVTAVPFLNGAFHWIGHSLEYCVVSFSTSKEEYSVMCLPEPMFFRKFGYVRYISISVLEGMLCFSSTHYELEVGGTGTCKLWVMKDYGVSESWTILFTIQDANLYSVHPQYRFGDGEVLLFCKYYWPNSCVLRTSKGPFGVWPERGLYFGIAYVESLISPKLLI